MRMTLISVDIKSLDDSISEVKNSIQENAYLLMNSQTLKCLEFVARDNLKKRGTNHKEIYRCSYKGNRVIILNLEKQRYDEARPSSESDYKKGGEQ